MDGYKHPKAYIATQGKLNRSTVTWPFYLKAGKRKNNDSEFGDGPFARSCQMVQNLPYWMASYALGHPKQIKVKTKIRGAICFGIGFASRWLKDWHEIFSANH